MLAFIHFLILPRRSPPLMARSGHSRLIRIDDGLDDFGELLFNGGG